MDKGTSGFTSYDFTDEVAEFIMDKTMENPEFMTYKLGHIHSHNTMNVFFSGTDVDELHDNVGNHNIYLSLIVNNFMDMKAKVCYLAAPSCYTCKDENGEEYQMPFENAEKIMFVQDCAIEQPFQEIVVEPTFEERIREIIKRDDEKPKTLPKPQPHYYGGNQVQSPAGYGLNSRIGTGNNTPVPPLANDKGVVYPLGQSLLTQGSEDNRPAFDQDEDYGIHDDIGEAITENFAAFLISLGEGKDSNVNLLETLEYLNKFDQDAKALAIHVVDNYAKYYQSFFEDIEDVSMEEYTDIITDVVGMYSEYKKEYPFLQEVIDLLDVYSTNLENKWRESLIEQPVK